jgi:hypothetical protein
LAIVSNKLVDSFEGAMAGGGDPATSPLYVFGPFQKLIVVAGVAHVNFGANVWFVVLTLAMVSAMYRLVMTWIVAAAVTNLLAGKTSPLFATDNPVVQRPRNKLRAYGFERASG